MNAPTPLSQSTRDSGGMSGPRYSIIPARAVFDDRLSAHEKIILAALGTYTDRDGWCYPSQKLLCDRLGIARSTLCAGLKRLASKEIGYIEVQPRTAKGRGKIGNEYRVKTDLPPLSVVVDNGLEKPMSGWADNGQQAIETAPMSAVQDNGADVRPAGHANVRPHGHRIIESNDPKEERPHSSCSNEQEQLVLKGDPDPRPELKPKKPRTAKSKTAYTEAFNEVWMLWPAHRRANSDKRKAFERYTTGVADFGAEKIEAAAKRYLSLPSTRKEDYQFCCLVEVFMNGKLEAAVEAVGTPGAARPEKTPVGFKLIGHKPDGTPVYDRAKRQVGYS